MTDHPRPMGVLDLEEAICPECNDCECEGPTTGLCQLDECPVCQEDIGNCDHEVLK